MAVVSNGDPPSSIKKRIGEFVSRYSSIAELVKLASEIKELLAVIVLLLSGIAVALHIDISKQSEKPERTLAQAEYQAPFHVPGTQYDGKNDPIVSTPRFGDGLKKPNITTKTQATRPPFQVLDAQQPEPPAKASISLWLQKICPLIFGVPAEADRS